MLTSISPLGEGARGQRHGLTVAASLVGGTLGGATAGGLLGVLGALLHLPRPALLGAVVLGLAVVADLAGVRVGSRQVDERWLGRYRGWVYGGGFGYQLGLGVVTVVTSAATPAVLALALLTGSSRAGLLVGTVFGLVRGLPLLLGASSTTPDALRVAAARRDRAARPVAVATTVLLGVGALVLGLLALGGAAPGGAA